MSESSPHVTEADSKDASTGKFTTLDPEALAASMNAVEGVAVVATVNEDGTPNAGIFVPMMVDADHMVLVLAPNRTRTNIERTGRCVVVYDVPNPNAPEKSGRHTGARLELELLDKDSDEYRRVAEKWPRMNPYTLLLRVVKRMAIG